MFASMKYPHRAANTRLSVPAAIWAAVVAGLVFLVYEMVMTPLVMGMSPWAPTRMIAAIAMGRDVLPPPDTFDAGVVVVAMLIHFMLSLVYGLVFATVAKGRHLGASTLLGAVFGLLLYLVNFYGFTSVFPWFGDARNWISVLGHILYGAILGAVYAWFANRTTGLIDSAHA